MSKYTIDVDLNEIKNRVERCDDSMDCLAPEWQYVDSILDEVKQVENYVKKYEQELRDRIERNLKLRKENNYKIPGHTFALYKKTVFDWDKDKEDVVKTILQKFHPELLVEKIDKTEFRKAVKENREMLEEFDGMVKFDDSDKTLTIKPNSVQPDEADEDVKEFMDELS